MQARIDYLSGRSISVTQPLRWLIRHKHEVNGFECGRINEEGYLMANLQRGPNDDAEYGRLHMTWKSPGIMLRWMHRPYWNDVPYYWQNANRYIIDTTRLRYPTRDGKPAYIGDTVVAVRHYGQISEEFSGIIVNIGTGMGTFDVADKYGSAWKVLRTDVRQWRNTPRDRQAAGLLPPCNYHNGDGFGTVCTCEDDS